MHWINDRRGLFVKLDAGEDLFESLEAIAAKELQNGGMILMAIGMLKNSVVGYYNGTNYTKRTLEKGHELLGLHGSIRVIDKSEESKATRIDMHIHCMLANDRHEVVGGHLFSAVVDPLVEMLIIPAEESRITVELNEKTGLREMRVDKIGE